MNYWHFRSPETNHHPAFINNKVRGTCLWLVYIVISSMENKPRTFPTLLFYMNRPDKAIRIKKELWQLKNKTISNTFYIIALIVLWPIFTFSNKNSNLSINSEKNEKYTTDTVLSYIYIIHCVLSIRSMVLSIFSVASSFSLCFAHLQSY